MINSNIPASIIRHPYTPYGIATTLVIGVGLILGGVGALAGHNTAVIGGLFASGAVLTLSSLLAAAIKVDQLYTKHRIEKDASPSAPFIPPDTTIWNAVREKNPHTKVASYQIPRGDPNLKGNATFGDHDNRINFNNTHQAEL